MRTPTRVVLMLLMLVSPCLGRDPAEPPDKAPDEPDHLVPINPYPAEWSQRYAKLYRKKLKLPERNEAAVMIYRPAFDAEESLVLHRSEGRPPSFALIHTRADRNIWYSMPENSDDGERKRVRVTRREAPLPSELAERVRRVWDRMLRGVRYPIPEEGVGADGVTIEFWRHGMYGKAWSPTGGAPKLFVDLGRSLVDYCTSPKDQRPNASGVVERRCQALESYLDRK